MHEYKIDNNRNSEVIKIKWPISCKLMVPVIVFLSTIQPFFGYKGFPFNDIRTWVNLMLILVTIIALITWAFIEKGIEKIHKNCFIFFIFLICTSVLMIIIGSISLTIDVGHRLQDIGTLILFAAGIIFFNKSRWEFLIKIFIFCAILSIIAGIYSLFFVNFSILLISERGLNTWQLPYYVWRLLYLWPILLFAAVFYRKKYSFIAITVFILNIILALSFLKRNIFFQMIMFSAIVMIGHFSKKLFFIEKIKNSCTFIIKIILFLAILLIIINLFLPTEYQKINNLVDLTTKRIYTQDFFNFSRFNEIKGLFKDFNNFQIIFGKGIGQSQNYNIGRHGGIHIGWGNLIFKGGMILFFYFSFSFLIILKKLFSKKIDGLTRVVISTIIWLFLAMLIDTVFWEILPNTFLFGACFFYSINYSVKTDKKKYLYKM